MTKRKPTAALAKPYWEMTAAELAEATREFDGPISFAQTRPPSKQMREREARARRGPSGSIREKPKTARQPAAAIAVGPHELVVQLDDDLLARATEYARRHKTTLPAMLDRGLRGLLAFAG